VVDRAGRMVPLEEVLAVLELTVAAVRAMKTKGLRLKATKYFPSHASRPDSRWRSAHLRERR
jgi:hypothetical protein